MSATATKTTQRRSTPAAPPVDQPRRLAPRTRKVLLAAHVVVGVGWLGVAVSKLALGVAAVRLADSDPGLAVAAYGLLDDPVTTITRVAAIATLVTGVALSVGTKWGLLRHWWIVTKLALTVGTILLGNQVIDGWTQQAIAGAAGAATRDLATAVGHLGRQLVAVMGLNVALLAAASVISTIKPWGRTPRGRRVAATRRAHARAAGATR
ncbi:MAG: hypothetical protein H0V93_07870 [Euzebyales bacterium]|nr:hypothetical protein [Euzebyales bacterium]